MLHQNGHSHNGFAPSPIVDAPYAMRPESDGAAYPACPSDYKPAPAPKPSRPGWRNAEPRYVHSLKWFDTDGIEHLHVIRSDDLDDVLRQVRTVKAFIAASKARAQGVSRAEPEATEPEPEAGEQTDSAYCPTHGTSKLRPSKFSGVYCAAKLADGTFCTFTSG
jgi:hypothetical protein